MVLPAVSLFFWFGYRTAFWVAATSERYWASVCWAHATARLLDGLLVARFTVGATLRLLRVDDVGIVVCPKAAAAAATAARRASFSCLRRFLLVKLRRLLGCLFSSCPLVVVVESVVDSIGSVTGGTCGGTVALGFVTGGTDVVAFLATTEAYVAFCGSTLLLLLLWTITWVVCCWFESVSTSNCAAELLPMSLLDASNKEKGGWLFSAAERVDASTTVLCAGKVVGVSVVLA